MRARNLSVNHAHSHKRSFSHEILCSFFSPTHRAVLGSAFLGGSAHISSGGMCSLVDAEFEHQDAIVVFADLMVDFASGDVKGFIRDRGDHRQFTIQSLLRAPATMLCIVWSRTPQYQQPIQRLGRPIQLTILPCIPRAIPAPRLIFLLEITLATPHACDAITWNLEACWPADSAADSCILCSRISRSLGERFDESI